jgi:Mn-dependent DtxR family transcriptional regulator
MAKLTQANEDYLEAIVMLAGEDRSPVRSVDIANRLDVSKPSVNKAVALLREEGFIEQQPYGDVYLTDAGAKYGEAVLERHNTLMRFFVEVLGVEPDVAEDEACCIEHVISEDTFQRWTEHIRASLSCCPAK